MNPDVGWAVNASLIIRSFNALYFLRLVQAPPLCTSMNPFDFRMLFAEAILMPEAQHVITGLFLSSFLRF